MRSRTLSSAYDHKRNQEVGRRVRRTEGSWVPVTSLNSYKAPGADYLQIQCYEELKEAITTLATVSWYSVAESICLMHEAL